MRTHTSEFKNRIKRYGRVIQGKIIYYPSYDLVSEGGDNILTESDLQLISEQANYDDPIEIDEENIFSISIIKNGDLLQSLMKEFDFEAKDELNIGSVVNPQFGLLTDEETQTYEYLDYGNYIVNSKEFNMDTQTWSYVCYDKMLFAMVKYRPLANVTFPITIKQYINLICNKIGLEFEDSNFVNHDQLIYDDLYKDKGLTYRDVFDEISKIVAGNLLINDDDKLEIRYINIANEVLLPLEYTPVEYLESNGNQYINTGIVGNNDTLINIKFKLNSRSSVVHLCGNISDSSSAISCNIGSSTTPISRWGSSQIQKTFSLNTKDIFDISISENGYYINNNKEWSPTINTFTTNGTIYLFGANGAASNRLNGRIYSCEIYADNVLVRNFVPCYRNSDNKGGFYDIVNDVFYVNQGTGNFTYGDVVEVIDTINEEYLKDTNVKMAEKFGVINSVAVLDTDNDLQFIAEDTQSIKENEMTRVTITDNLIALNGDTQTIADNVLNQLNGLYYYINDFATTGVCYYDFLDMFNVEARGNIYQCLLLNNEITISQGIEEQIFTERLEESETSANEYTTSVMSNKQVQFRINQQEGKLETKVEKDGVISAINQSAEEIQIQADKLSFEGATINMTADNVKIKGENLDIDSGGKITLTDNNAGALMQENAQASYIIESEATDEYQGQTAKNTFINKILSGGKINEYENYNNIEGSSGYGHYFGGIKENIYRYPTTKWYMKSIDYDEYNPSAGGTYNAIEVGINQIKSISNVNGTTTEPFVINANGNIICVSLIQTSKEENKKNFEKLTNAKEILNSTDIYKYNFKNEDDNTKKSIGFVIGDGYNYSQEITSAKNDGANIYSMISVLWQVVKEQQEEIQELKEMINNGKY